MTGEHEELRRAGGDDNEGRRLSGAGAGKSTPADEGVICISDSDDDDNHGAGGGGGGDGISDTPASPVSFPRSTLVAAAATLSNLQRPDAFAGGTEFRHLAFTASSVHRQNPAPAALFTSSDSLTEDCQHVAQSSAARVVAAAAASAAVASYQASREPQRLNSPQAYAAATAAYFESRESAGAPAAWDWPGESTGGLSGAMATAGARLDSIGGVGLQPHSQTPPPPVQGTPAAATIVMAAATRNPEALTAAQRVVALAGAAALLHSGQQ